MNAWSDTALQNAEQFLREGRLDEARSLLAGYVQKNPASARGWWLLSFAITDPRQQIECLERVLRIDPNNEVTRTRLTKLKGASAPAPAFYSPETPASINQEAPRSFTPFLPEENVPLQVPRSMAKSPPAKKWANWILPVSILSVFLFAAVGIVGFVVVLKGRQQALPQPTQSPLLPAQSTPTLLGLPPTWTPTITDTPRATSTRLQEIQVNLTATDIPNSTMWIATGLDAPDFTLRNVTTGEQTSLSDYKGRPVIIFFFASWGVYGKVEAPALQQIYDEFQNENLMVLAVSISESADDARAFRESFDLTFPVLRDGDAAVFDKYKGTHIPLHYFVDSDGKVSTFVRGLMDYSQLNIRTRVLLNLIPTPIP